MVMVEFRRGRPAEMRLALGRAIVDVCVELLGVPRRSVMVEFTPHVGEDPITSHTLSPVITSPRPTGFAYDLRSSMRPRM
jgi:hypothetical protein